jgi:GC-rich sequence DNA-binding factor
MVSTTLIPQLCKLFSGGGFDPYSARHMKRIVDLVEQVELCMDRSDPKFQVTPMFLVYDSMTLLF